MHESACDLCENPAVIHETVVRYGVVKVRRLCRGHGLNLWRESVVPAVAHAASLREKPALKTALTVPPSGFRRERSEPETGS